MEINKFKNQIKAITLFLQKSSLSHSEKFPSIDSNKLAWEGFRDISNLLKNLPYSKKYLELKNSNNFNFLLMDGAIIQLMYEFDLRTKNKLIRHRLLYYPSPLTYKIYRDEEFESSINDENYDVQEDYNIPFPIRFDYDSDAEKYKPITHSYSHLTLGEFIDCRIPVYSPVLPAQFINFILLNFYRKGKNDLFFDNIVFNIEKTICDEEEKFTHIKP